MSILTITTKTKLNVSILITIVIHAGGLLALQLWGSDFLASLSPYNLLLMALLFSWNEVKFKSFLSYIPIVMLGFTAEWLGVHKGWVFGNYAYSQVLGFSFLEVPLIIGVNWALVVSGCFVISHYLVKQVLKVDSAFMVVVLTGMLATLFDFVMEPVAIHFNFWQWEGGAIPIYNYISWWAVSTLAAAWLYKLKIKPNHFAVALVVAQFLFFIGIILMIK
ncbi:MAG: carotenoid biosynthesis protein [Chryseotalea sp.]|jgi:putative membrane protein